jgi:hypothetical protein
MTLNEDLLYMCCNFMMNFKVEKSDLSNGPLHVILISIYKPESHGFDF